MTVLNSPYSRIRQRAIFIIYDYFIVIISLYAVNMTVLNSRIRQRAIFITYDYYSVIISLRAAVFAYVSLQIFCLLL